jgi:hypothetical protein
LHALLAREANLGVVLRRGPSDAYCAIGWDRKRDTFSVGQWLRGRIYERRCDLSPDGKYLIYFAFNGHADGPTGGSWTAVSRAPYLRAVALWGKGDAWHGGGLFVDDKHYWLNDGYGHRLLGETGEVKRTDSDKRATQYGGECPGVYYPRLIRDGWTYLDQLGARLDSADVFEKRVAHGWSLRKLARATVNPPLGKGVYHDEHELVGYQRELPRHDWEWAEVDGDRLVWATGGVLWAGKITKRSAMLEDPVTDARVLHDFNDMTFSVIAAPYEGVRVNAVDDQ